MATSLTRNNAAGTSARKGTLSLWIKFNDPVTASGGHMIHSHYESGGNYFNLLRTQSGDNLQFHSTVSGSDKIKFVTNRKFRDISAWYHIVWAVDTTQATEANRVKIYINGVQETSFSTATYPTQNQDLKMNISGTVANINKNGDGAGMEHSCLMSHLHWIDGTQYAASDFGSTDSTTGEWKIKTDVSVTYGTDGYFLFKDDNSANDQSGNGNNFTITGTLTKTEDNPSNVFATMNPLQFNSSGEYFTNGNNTLVSHGGGSWTTHYGFSTLAMGSGKYYVEMKANNTGTSGQSYPIGLIDAEQTITSSLEDNGLASIRASSGNIVGSSFTNQTGLTAVSAGDILAIAYDGVNGTLQFYRNGSAHGTAITGIDTSKDYYIACDTYEGASNFDFNFGNGYFGTTAVSSAGTNASGIGIFEYNVPANYTALSTKGLNE